MTKAQKGEPLLKAAVIGHPISHSKSPLIHGHWMQKYGIKASYEAIDVPCDQLQQKVRDMKTQSYVGFSVTMPHKQAIMELCDEIDEIARRIGAVNTVWFEQGRICATNTDAFGFLENIRTVAPQYDFSAGPAAVLGAGGAARAVVAALEDAGAPEIRMINRTIEKAQAIADTSGKASKITAHSWTNRNEALKGSMLLINTTSLGMKGQGQLDINLAGLCEGALVADLVYVPRETELLRQAKARGLQTAGGIGMLLHQARPAFAKWFGVLPDIDPDLLQKVEAL